MNADQAIAKFPCLFSLRAYRQQGSKNQPAVHQKNALNKLNQWYLRNDEGERGGILALPTGAGKTFTTTYFISRFPLAQQFKVLWLAHTHHLLEQAYDAFKQVAALVPEPKDSLNVRVVSGTPGHWPLHSVKETDDVLIGTLQTVALGIKTSHQPLENFIRAAQGKLFVVFDEAHHSPAPSYRTLVKELRKRCPRMSLLGLTATPTYTDEGKRGWLKELFPQGILFQITPNDLMVQGILAEPEFLEAQTVFEPSFDEREYQKWIGTHRDLPEDIITSLAASQQRNDFIIGHYVENKDKYKKTIIFADRWFQCDYLREGLIARHVKADVVYSHADADPGSAEARNRRTADENARVLTRFKNGDLDVLINVRMLTEGTDVPKVETVLLTRQTTSQILLTQMIGRALRGPEFGGTAKAHIVSFIDNWRQKISWAAYDQLTADPTTGEPSPPAQRPPVQLISIDLVRRLARQMDTGQNIASAPFTKFLPSGWFHVEYHTRIGETDDIEPITKLVLVFESEKPCFDQFLERVSITELGAFQEETVQAEDIADKLEDWKLRFFGQSDGRVGGAVTDDLCDVARHLAQNDMRKPVFFPFEEINIHDLDSIALEHIKKDIGPRQVDSSLRNEYQRADRLWRVLYFNYGLFKCQYDSCANRLTDAMHHGNDPATHVPAPLVKPEYLPNREPSEELKKQVKVRDAYRCLCCGSGKSLHVDHIDPWFHSGINDFENLQTLCKPCNKDKGIDKINFRFNRTPRAEPSKQFPSVDVPFRELAKDPDQWEMFLRCSMNFFYRCAAVSDVEIGMRGRKFRNWRVVLFPGNDPKWLDPFKDGLVQRIREARIAAGYEAAPDNIDISN